MNCAEGVSRERCEVNPGVHDQSRTPGTLPRTDPMKRLILLPLLLLSLVTPARAFDGSSMQLLSNAWPGATAARIDQVGRGVGVVFSPDLSVRDNCRFYETLGFACFQDADWSRVLDDVHRHNVLYPESRIRTLVLETHGTNGNGAKLQATYSPTADRSYISVGALQERLEPEGVEYVIISACNSGRLLRPAIYARLDPNNGDKLFLPPTCGIVDASDDFEPERSSVTILTPRASHIETTIVGRIAELAPATRRALAAAAKAHGVALPREFAVSDMMVQMITRDPYVQLVANQFVNDLSKEIASQDRSEQNFKRFMTYLNAVAARESVGKGVVVAKARTRKKGRAVAVK
jgi:hypothetical protein